MSRPSHPRNGHSPLRFAATAVLLLAGLVAPTTVFGQAACPDGGTWVTANVVALDHVFIYNRLGAFAPGMIYALERDVVPIDGNFPVGPGNAMLREDERPRPLTLRVNAGDCIQINFTNLLNPNRADGGAEGPVPVAFPINWDNQPITRNASVRVLGMQLLGDIESDGSFVGRNPGNGGLGSLVAPGGTKTYYLYAEREGTYFMYSAGAQTGGEGDGGTIAFGLFGAINVEPPGSEWYRSQLTRVEMDLAQAVNCGLDGCGDDPATLEIDEGANDVPATTPHGQPILNYDATYPTSHPRSGGVAGVPIIKMTNAAGEIVHSDLTAIITGPNRGEIGGAAFDYPENRILAYDDEGFQPGKRDEPFREMTVIFHDEIKAVQAFDVYEDAVLGHTLHGVRDGFAINYGTGGIGSEILANRLGLGPMADCVECKYEEFFLTSWVVGDPAMITLPLANQNLGPNPNAKALYPDDPSNTYHSYIGDHLKIRNLHAGPKEHHIFHLHAHQWVFTPDSDESAYLDSQNIGPGGAYTYEIAYSGSGNRNKTPGDAIFHCHFYPHFAQGMWGLWRNHDVFENGTPLDADGKPVSDPVHLSRALPDGEIPEGTPTPGVVPIPGKPLAPMPTMDMPGYPFYIPGVAGHRPPKPPLDTKFDGGLPRHVVLDGVAHFPPLNRLDFDKVNEELDVLYLPEGGTQLELNAMEFHGGLPGGASTGAWRATFDTDGNAANFRVNGLPGIAGAPFADPCVADDGSGPAGLTGGVPNRTYKAAAFEIDAVYNKKGWHFPQHRMEALQEDVKGILDGVTPPQPFFFRANSNDCIEFWHSNLLPNVYQLDDFQVRTPTDVMGQHIHLVKFDVTSSDGSANGYNYEDGTFSPDEVIERIHAIRAHTNLGANPCPADETNDDGRPLECPVAKVNTLLPQDLPVDLLLGAQTTIQRWFADDVLNNDGKDRTLRTVFTHDHYAPSTQQQAGYYQGLLVEPAGSKWLFAEGPNAGAEMYTRDDGGPTDWQAIIDLTQALDPDIRNDSYREFMLEFQDFQLAYEAGSDNSLKPITDNITGVMTVGIHDPDNAVNPPARKEIGLPFLLQIAPECPGGGQRPCPEAISADDPGIFTVNYRGEPTPHRIGNPWLLNPAGGPTQAAGVAGDLSHLFRSDVIRDDPVLNTPPEAWPYGPLTGGLLAGDPFTPLMRTYENDRVQIRILVGAHEEDHTFTMHGIRWLFEPSWPNSGYRNSQGMGISEHFEFNVPALGPVKADAPKPWEDYLYQTSAASDAIWNGNWGIMRAYDPDGSGINENNIFGNLATLPNNPDGKAPPNANPRDFQGVCPRTPGVQPNRDPRFKNFHIVAVLARDVLESSPGAADGDVVYNSRPVNGGPLTDPNTILYVRATDLDTNGKLKDGFPVEPLVLRVNAHDCIDIRLENRLPAGDARVVMPNQAGFSTMPTIVQFFNSNQVAPSNHVGLHGQLVTYDMFDSDGANVGFNPVQTAAPGGEVTYRWYAGDVVVCQGGEPAALCAGKVDGFRVAVPIEFGATALMSSDRIKHSQRGAIGSLIVEPQGATWEEDGFILVEGRGNRPDRLECDPNRPETVPCTRTSATVTKADNTTFREFVLHFQDDLNLRCDGCGLTTVDPHAPPGSFADPDAVPNLADSEDPEDSGQRALNYNTEPMWLRLGFAPDESLENTRNVDFTQALSNLQVGGDPETPIFTAEKGTPVWFRVVQPGGHHRVHVFTVHGHGWQMLPFEDQGRKLGDNPLSQWAGQQDFIGPSSHYNFLLTHGAGGKGGVVGDYLLRDFASFQFDGGLWGILRVCADDSNPDTGGNVGDRICLVDQSGN